MNSGLYKHIFGSWKNAFQTLKHIFHNECGIDLFLETKKFPSVHRDLPQPTPTEGKLATLVNVQSGVRRDCSRELGMHGITLALFSAHIYW